MIKVTKVTREVIDYMGSLDASIKGLTEELSELKEKVREQFFAGCTVEGYAFDLAISEEIEKHDKVDYRSLLMAEIGEEKLLTLEAKAAKKVIGRDASRISVKLSPRVRKNPELLVRAKEAIEKLTVQSDVAV
ncbi:MAG: hypothetical protein KGI50_07135 [Patescibacteria group bacterium]|nr:hypothetical protein [Patescibacteria group bacterium]MDE2439146.1 hypothetical protein [Patescibacteria group bacterium]